MDQYKLSSPELEALKEQLSDQFPAYHWNHVPIWSAFWQLVQEINEGSK